MEGTFSGLQEQFRGAGLRHRLYVLHYQLQCLLTTVVVERRFVDNVNPIGLLFQGGWRNAMASTSWSSAPSTSFK